MLDRLSPRLRRHAAIWLAWTAAGLFYFTQETAPRFYRGETVPWRPMLIGWIASMYICAAFTPTILWLGRRWPIGQGRASRSVAVHAASSIVFSVLSTSIEVPVLTALHVFPPAMGSVSLAAAVSNLLVYSFHGALIRYWAVVGVQAVARSLSHSAQLAAQLSAAQLGALKMQLQPHFLFNTLGAIMALVRQSKTREAEAMIGRLSDLLRLTLEDVNAQEVPLWRELDFLRTYLSIEEERFSDRLRVDIAADAEVSEAFVPHMVLQPIVENAVRHGLGESEQAVRIQVCAVRMGEDLVLTVTDDGPGGFAGFGGKGIGLTNTRDRLQRLHGDRASLIAGNRVPRGVEVIVRVPFHTGPHGERECA